MDTTLILCDNESCDNREPGISTFKIKMQMMMFQYSHTEDVDDDVLTKPLSRVKFEHFQDKLGVVRKDLP